EIAVSNEFEQIAVEGVGAGSRYRIDGGSGVYSVLSGQRTGFHLEFLQGVRKRQRQIQVVVGIVMEGPIEQVSGREGLPARDRYRLPAISSAERAADRGRRVHSTGGELDQ